MMVKTTYSDETRFKETRKLRKTVRKNVVVRACERDVCRGLLEKKCLLLGTSRGQRKWKLPSYTDFRNNLKIYIFLRLFSYVQEQTWKDGCLLGCFTIIAFEMGAVRKSEIRSISTRLHGPVSQKTGIFILSVRIWSLTNINFIGTRLHFTVLRYKTEVHEQLFDMHFVHKTFLKWDL